MKKLFFIIIILFKIQFTANEDDIMDFELEGMSIGDSLLTYFSNEEIQSMEKVFYPGSDKYIQIEPGRFRKLLLNKRELKNILFAISAKGQTCVPVKLFWKGHLAKLEIALAKGKKNIDKKQTKKVADIQRDEERGLKKFK